MSAARRALLCLVVVAIATTACSGAGDTADRRGTTTSTTTSVPGTGDLAFPGQSWERIDPADASMDAVALEDVAAKAEASDANCFVVTRDGRLVGEWYWNDTTADTTQQVFSITKSFTSVLVGIAQAEGRLSIDDRASAYLPQWTGTPSEDITIRNLLSNDSGRHWDYESDYVKLLFQEPDKTTYALGLAQDAPPGTTWAYNNTAIQTLSPILDAALDADLVDYAADRLFAPLGMEHTAMAEDEAGNAMTAFGMTSTCLDMARFGNLLLARGIWRGQQVVPPAYIDEATQPSTDHAANYGFLFWLNRSGTIVNPLLATTGEEGEELPEGQQVPGAPEEMFWALGFGEQILAVDPGTRTVVVRLAGHVPRDGVPFTEVEAAAVVTEAIVE